MNIRSLFVAAAVSAAACAAATPHVVETTGKSEVELADVPQAVLAAAKAARPELAVEAAEHEVRDGRHYYDVGGRLPDGSELELDIMETNGGWTVVEIQRDIAFDDAPAPVRNIMAEERGDFTPTRVIESDQGDGVVIYELFGPGPDGDDVKIEVKFEDGAAALLTEEWAH